MCLRLCLCVCESVCVCVCVCLSPLWPFLPPPLCPSLHLSHNLSFCTRCCWKEKSFTSQDGACRPQVPRVQPLSVPLKLRSTCCRSAALIFTHSSPALSAVRCCAVLCCAANPFALVAVFSNVVSEDQLKEIAEADAHNLVKEVRPKGCFIAESIESSCTRCCSLHFVPDAAAPGGSHVP